MKAPEKPVEVGVIRRKKVDIRPSRMLAPTPLVQSAPAPPPGLPPEPPAPPPPEPVPDLPPPMDEPPAEAPRAEAIEPDPTVPPKETAKTRRQASKQAAAMFAHRVWHATFGYRPKGVHVAQSVPSPLTCEKKGIAWQTRRRSNMLRARVRGKLTRKKLSDVRTRAPDRVLLTEAPELSRLQDAFTPGLKLSKKISWCYWKIRSLNIFWSHRRDRWEAHLDRSRGTWTFGESWRAAVALLYAKTLIRAARACREAQRLTEIMRLIGPGKPWEFIHAYPIVGPTRRDAAAAFKAGSEEKGVLDVGPVWPYNVVVVFPPLTSAGYMDLGGLLMVGLPAIVVAGDDGQLGDDAWLAHVPGVRVSYGVKGALAAAENLFQPGANRSDGKYRGAETLVEDARRKESGDG